MDMRSDTIVLSRMRPKWIGIAAPALLMLLSPAAAVSEAPRGLQVVIDPGHGGADFGTIFKKPPIQLSEKDVTLVLARETARQLRERGYRVTLTRETDKDMPLPDRTALANKLGADLFISIHMNSASDPAAGDAQGIETYFLNNATDESSRRLARLENAVLRQEPGSKLNKAEQDDVALILKDLRLDANLDSSKLLACLIQERIVSAAAEKTSIVPRNRGVRQALFYVLLGADMPSVLVEAGFLSNARDRAAVLTPAGQRAIGLALSDAIEEFRRSRGTPRAFAGLSRCKVH